MLDLLRKLGLNKYESEAYLALVKLGSSSAYNLSIKSKVPFGRIYDALKTLEQKGLVEVIPSKPKKYKPVNPQIALEGLIDDKQNELIKLRSVIKESIKNLKATGEEEQLVSVTTGKSNFAKKVGEHFDYKKEYWATSEGMVLQDWYPSIQRHYTFKDKAASKRFILIDKNKTDPERVNEVIKSGVNVRHYPLPGVRMLISDEELVTMSIQDPKHEWVNIHVKNKLLGMALTKILKSIWKQAEKID